MSGLAALLAGRIEPGLFRWRSAYDVADIRHTVEHAGWRFHHLDGVAIESKAEFLAAIGDELGFPEHYGHNFDALADCLHDVVAGDSGGAVLLWDSWSPFARADERAFSVALTVLGTRVNADRGGPFAVLLRGPGPEPVGMPELD